MSKERVKSKKESCQSICHVTRGYLARSSMRDTHTRDTWLSNSFMHVWKSHVKEKVMSKHIPRDTWLSDSFIHETWHMTWLFHTRHVLDMTLSYTSYGYLTRSCMRHDICITCLCTWLDMTPVWKRHVNICITLSYTWLFHTRHML